VEIERGREHLEVMLKAVEVLRPTRKEGGRGRSAPTPWTPAADVSAMLDERCVSAAQPHNADWAKIEHKLYGSDA